MDTELREKAQENGMPVPTTISLVCDLGMAGSLAAAGWFCYGGLIIVQGLMQIGLHSKSDKKL